MYSRCTVAVVFTRLISWRVVLSRRGSGRHRRTKRFPFIPLGVRMPSSPFDVLGLPAGEAPAPGPLGLRAAVLHYDTLRMRPRAAPPRLGTAAEAHASPAPLPQHGTRSGRSGHATATCWGGGLHWTGLRRPLLPVISFLTLIRDLAQPAFLIMLFKLKGLMFVSTHWDLSFCISSSTCD